MKFKILSILLFSVSAAFAQMSELDRINLSVPLYPGCTKTESRYDYFVQSVSAIVLDSVNAYHKVHPVTDEKLQIRLMLFTEITGIIEVRDAESANSAVGAIAKASLQKLPRVIPIYRPEGSPVSCSNAFVLVLQKDKDTGLFSHIYQSKASEWRDKPMAIYHIVDAAFPGCEDSKRFGSCFEEKFAAWLLPKLTSAAVAEMKEKMPVIRITIDKGGRLQSYDFFSVSDTLKKEAEIIMEAFPNVAPSTVDGLSYMATYVFPIQVK